MKSLHEVGLLRFVKIQVLTIYCLVHLIDSLDLTSKNSQTNFEVGSQATFTCTILPYTGTLNWYYMEKKVAGCTGFTCTVIDSDQGAFVFQYDMISYIFILNIPSVQKQYDGKSFTCNDGTNNQSIAITVKDKENEGKNNYDLLGLIAIGVVALGVAAAVVWWCTCCCIYRFNCCRKVKGAKRITMTVKQRCSHSVVLTWNKTCVCEDQPTYVIIIKKLNRETDKYDVLPGSPIAIEKQQVEKRNQKVDSLFPATEYKFKIEVRDTSGNVLARSEGIKVTTLDVIKLRGTPQNTTTIDLQWDWSDNLKNSKLQLVRTIKKSNFSCEIANTNNADHAKFRPIVHNMTRQEKHFRSCTVCGLQATTEYEFIVKMKDGKDRTQSNAINIQTLDIVLRTTSRENTVANFTVIWPLKHVEDSLELPLYRLFYKKIEPDQDFINKPIPEPDDSNCISLKDLNANKRYSYYLTVTDKGNTYTSNIVTDK